MRAFQPAELWAVRIFPMSVEIPSGRLISQGSREEAFVGRYRWRWVAELHRSWLLGKDGALYFYSVRDADNGSPEQA